MKINVKNCAECNERITIQAGLVKGVLYASYRCEKCGHEQAWRVHIGNAVEIDPKMIGKL